MHNLVFFQLRTPGLEATSLHLMSTNAALFQQSRCFKTPGAAGIGTDATLKGVWTLSNQGPLVVVQLQVELFQGAQPIPKGTQKILFLSIVHVT